jgi:hypothetical protein
MVNFSGYEGQGSRLWQNVKASKWHHYYNLAGSLFIQEQICSHGIPFIPVSVATLVCELVMPLYLWTSSPIFLPSIQSSLP